MKRNTLKRKLTRADCKIYFGGYFNLVFSIDLRSYTHHHTLYINYETKTFLSNRPKERIKTQTTSSPSFAQSVVRDANESTRASRPQDFTRPFFSHDFLSRHARRTQRKRDQSYSNRHMQQRSFLGSVTIPLYYLLSTRKSHRIFLTVKMTNVNSQLVETSINDHQQFFSELLASARGSYYIEVQNINSKTNFCPVPFYFRIYLNITKFSLSLTSELII